VLIVHLLPAGPVTAHALALAAYRVGIPLRKALRDDLAQAVKQSHPSVEENLG
jgi:multisubunit Na+/H+ antiporter MnhG subunit